MRNRLVLSRLVTSFCFLPCWLNFSSCCNCPDCFLERLCNFWDYTLLPVSFILAVVIFSISDFFRNSLELIDCRNQISGLKPTAVNWKIFLKLLILSALLVWEEFITLEVFWCNYWMLEEYSWNFCPGPKFCNPKCSRFAEAEWVRPLSWSACFLLPFTFTLVEHLLRGRRPLASTLGLNFHWEVLKALHTPQWSWALRYCQCHFFCAVVLYGQLWVYLLGMQFVSALPHSSPVFLALLQGMGSYKKQQRKCVSEEGREGLKSGKCRRIVHCSDRNPVLFNRKPGVTDMEVLCAISDFK